MWARAMTMTITMTITMTVTKTEEHQYWNGQTKRIILWHSICKYFIISLSYGSSTRQCHGLPIWFTLDGRPFRCLCFFSPALYLLVQLYRLECLLVWCAGSREGATWRGFCQRKKQQQKSVLLAQNNEVRCLLCADQLVIRKVVQKRLNIFQASRFVSWLSKLRAGTPYSSPTSTWRSQNGKY